MHNSNLFDTLSTFNQEDFKRFGDLVKSPFFNTNPTLVNLYELIKKHFPEISHKSLKKESAFKKLFPRENYNDNRMRLLIHRMNALAEEYLAQVSIDNNNSWQKIFLLQSLKSRRLFKAYDKHLKEARIINEEENKNTNEYYFVQFTLENTNIAAQVSKNLDANEKAVVKGQVNLVSQSINCFAMITILKYSLFMENINYRLKFEPDHGFLNEILSHLQNNNYKEHPIIMIYYYLMMLLKEPNNVAFYTKAKNIFFKNEDDFHPIDSMNIYINLENYLWKLSRKDHTKLKGEILNLYKRRLEKNNYKLAGYIPNQIFKRVVRASLMGNVPGYAEKFIEKYKDELDPSYKEGVNNFVLAQMCFHNKEYGKALEYLSVAHNEDISHKIEVKNLILFINYEQKDFESLRLALDSYRHFLKNNKTISEQVRNRATTVIRALHRLSKLAYEYDEFEASKLAKDLKENDDLENREWFLSKIEGLIIK